MKVRLRQDRLAIVGLELWGFHGVLENERRKGGRFCLDLEMDVDLKRALETDCVEDSVDYRDIVATVREINRSHRYSLIECFATALADTLLTRFEKVDRIGVRVAKLDPPGLGRVQQVAVSIVRERP